MSSSTVPKPEAKLARSTPCGVSGPASSSRAEIARDSRGRLYVANGNKRVLVFGKNARGNVRPIRVLRAGMPVGSVSMTPDNRLMVAGSTAIKIYRRSASGNATPVRQIAGDKAQLNGAYDAKMNVDGRVWVAFGEAELISVFAPGANGNVAPERTITADWAGPGLWEPELLSFDRAGRGYVGLHSGHVYVLGSTATGDATPQLVLSNRRHGHVDGLSVSRTGKVAVTGGNKITLYPRVRALTAPWAVRAVSVSGSPAAKNRVVRWAKPLADGGSAITRYRDGGQAGDHDGQGRPAEGVATVLHAQAEQPACRDEHGRRPGEEPQGVWPRSLGADHRREVTREKDA